MTVISRIALVLAIALLVVPALQAQEMTKEEWQKQISSLTAKKNDLTNKLSALQKEIADLKQQNAEKDAAIKKCEEELMAMVDGTPANIAAFEAELGKIDGRLIELSKLSNQDLYDRRGEFDTVQGWIDAARKNKLAALTKYHNRLNDYQGRLDALRRNLQQLIDSGALVRTYTVGTWAKDRDCLWNIAKKPAIYDNAFLWPKIWQANKDKIKNPDIIKPGQKLKVPPTAPLSKEEKAAERSYWQNKQSSQ